MPLSLYRTPVQAMPSGTARRWTVPLLPASFASGGVHEEDAGGELTVDHYIPLVAGGDDGDENLVYACFRCNLFKGDFYPTDADRAKGHFILHPFAIISSSTFDWTNMLAARQELLEVEIRELKNIIHSQERYIARLKELVGGAQGSEDSP